MLSTSKRLSTEKLFLINFQSTISFAKNNQ